jgi:hypothetical protein
MPEIDSEDADLLRRIDTRLTEIESSKSDPDMDSEERAALDAERLALEKEGADILAENDEKGQKTT